MTMLPAALTLLMGVGEAGQRVAAAAWERLEREPLAQAGGVRLVTIDAGEPAPARAASPGPDASAASAAGGGRPTTRRDAIREAVQQLTRQRTVATVEKAYAIRRPAGRYLRLQVVCIAALAETTANLLLECVRSIQWFKHPAAGLQVLFVLDATHPRDPGEVAPDALSTLEALQAEWQALAARSRRDWSAAPRLRCFLAHPHRADGSRLAVRASGGVTPGYASGALPGRSAPEGPGTLAGGNTPGDAAGAEDRVPAHGADEGRGSRAFDRGAVGGGGRAPGQERVADEFEATLAAAIAGHVAPGPLHDALASGTESDPEELPFALLGWASDRFPRELLLERAASLIAADLLERTASGGVPSAECPVPSEEDLLSRGTRHTALGTASEASEWLRSRDEILLSRRRLLIRLLSPDVEESPIQVDAEPEALRPSLYQRLKERMWGRPAVGTPARAGAERPLYVRLDLRAGAWRSSDPRRWPAELLALDARGSQEFDDAVQLLQDQHLSRTAVQELVDAFARCAGLCVRRQLGGTHAARELIDEALREAERRARQADAVPFGEPDPPRDLGLSGGGGLEEAWRLFRRECERLPGWPAVLARGLAFGALGTTACGSLGEGSLGEMSRLLLGWMGVAVSVATAILWYRGALGRLQRLGEYVAECIRAKYGRRLLEYAQLAAGTPKREGVYQAVSRHFRDVEIPTLERFEAEREALIGRMRENPPFSPDSTSELLAEATEAAELHRSVRESLSDACLGDEALELLRDHDIYASWRDLEPDRLLETTTAYARRKHLLAWEHKPLGDFLRDLLRLQEAPERRDELFVARVTERMDHLALRSVPLAPGPFGPALRAACCVPGEGRPSPPQHAAHSTQYGSEATITVAVPASLGWHEGDADTGALLPADSIAGSHAIWFGQSPNAVRLQVDEADTTACVVTIAGLSPAAALQALGDERPLQAPGSRLQIRKEEPLAPLTASETIGTPSPAWSLEPGAWSGEEERRA